MRKARVYGSLPVLTARWLEARWLEARMEGWGCEEDEEGYCHW